MIFLFIFSLLGRSLFQDIDILIDDYDENLIRFDTFYRSFIQCFLVSTGEHWTEIMYYVMANFSANACVYFVVLVLASRLVLVYLTQAALLASVLPGNANGKMVGAHVIQLIFKKHTLRIGFERFRWNTAVGIVEKISFTSWCRAAQTFGGSTRLINLVQNLGLRGEIMRSVRLQLLHFKSADINTVWEDTRLEGMERAKLQLLVLGRSKECEAGDFIGKKILSDGGSMITDRSKNSVLNASSQLPPALSALPVKVVEARDDWISQAKIASLVARFVYEHVPLGFDVVRDKEDGELSIINKVTRAKELLSKPAREVAAEIAEAILTLDANESSTPIFNPKLITRSVFNMFLHANQKFNEYENEEDSACANTKGHEHRASVRDGPWYRFQRFSRALVFTIFWKYLVIFMILASCVLVLATPKDTSDTSLYSILEYIYILFLFAGVLLMVGRGSKSHQSLSGGIYEAIHIYFKNGWNCLDYYIRWECVVTAGSSFQVIICIFNM